MTRRYLKPLLVLAAIVAALSLTVTRTDTRFTVRAEQTLSAATSGPYDLAALRIFNATLVRVKENYVDPTRIDPRRMLDEALDRVERSVAEVMVDDLPDGKTLRVRVDSAASDFDVSGVDSPWALSAKLKEIFKFVEKHIHVRADRSEVMRDVEYAAINGMLASLDPHSVLMDPDIAKEMELSTRGEFGGLGIVIGMRRGHLTIIKPLPGTPASRAGLKAGDRIVQINDESTVNMTLTEAVTRLRGQPRTRVTVYVERGAAPVAKHVLTRDIIQIESIHKKLLKNDVGYLRIESFQGNTEEDLARALEQLRAEGARALVLDLRSNPGGLLDQAVRVADLFIEQGTLVATVGGGKQREDKRAQDDGDEGDLPMVVLVNEQSASASEIVAGALKNLDRAIVLGRQTFGKGSVQVLYDNEDGSKLKLTIAQYLTPGDVSIQEVGITPDLELRAVRAHAGLPFRFFARDHGTRESDLDQPLARTEIARPEKPLDTIYYLAPPPTQAELEAEDEEADPEEIEPPPEPEDVVEDAEVQFARDLVAQARATRRSEQLREADAFLRKRRSAEEAKIAEALGKFGIDWTPPPPDAAAPQLEVAVTTAPPDGKVAAGEPVRFTLRVHNRGAVPAWQVRGMMEWELPFAMPEHEFLVGKVGAGETRTATVEVKVPKQSLARADQLTVQVSDGLGHALPPGRTAVEVRGLPRPLFAYGTQLLDGAPANGDGLVQKGEKVRLRVEVRNLGEGKALKTYTTLRNTSGPGIFISKGRFPLGPIEPRKSASAEFEFEVRPDFPDKEFTVELMVYDSLLRERLSERLRFPLAPPRPAPAAADGFVKVAPRSGKTLDVRAGADPASPRIGTIGAGSIAKLTGRYDGWVKVDLDGRAAFLPADQTAPDPGPAAASFTPLLQVTPPVLAVTRPPLVTREATATVRGHAADDNRVADVFVIVSNEDAKVDGKKVYYQSYKGATDPRRAAFEARVPLWPGINLVTVVARENDDVQSQQTLILRREAAATAEAPPPAAPAR